MAKTKLTKGSETIYVDSAQVDQHLALGWSRYPKARIDSDVLTLDGAAVSASAAEINGLVNQPVDAGTLETVSEKHYQITPAAASATYVHAAIELTAAAQDIVTGITDPDYPRTLTIKGNVSGIEGDVILSGDNIAHEEVSDTIALNGTSEVEGVLALGSVNNIHLPAQTHTPAYQVETATVVGTISTPGNAAVIVTAAGMTGSPKTLSVAMAGGENNEAIATKIQMALNADAAVTALFTVGGTGATVTLTRKIYAANDATLNISIADDTCDGITTAGTSANTTAGVPVDTVSVGIANKFGIPHIVYNAALLRTKLFDGSSDDGTLAVDADEIEKNLFIIDGTPDGEKVLDLYYMA